MVADELDEIGIALRGVRSQREGLLLDLEAGVRNRIAQGVAHLVEGDGVEFLGLGTAQKGDRLAVKDIEHARRDTRKDERYVLVLANHELHGCRYLADVVS